MAWAEGDAVFADVSELETVGGFRDLDNLTPSGGSPAVADTLQAATDAVYHLLLSMGVDMTKLANRGAYKPAIAAHFLAIFVRSGYLDAPDGREAPVDPYDWSAPIAKRIQPQFTQGEEGPRLGAGIPKVKNLNTGRF